ncbi:MAG: T9SS type A sorting domain-containing protein [Candidatus Zixiibacteriota bacterium]
MRAGVKFFALLFSLLFLAGVSLGAEICGEKVKCLNVAGCCSLTTSFCDVEVGEPVTITFYYIENGVLDDYPCVFTHNATPPSHPIFFRPPRGEAWISHTRLDDYNVEVTVDSTTPGVKTVHLWVYLNTGEHVGVNFQMKRESFASAPPQGKPFGRITNSPNPFNPNTNITYELLVGSHVELTIYNIRGQKVKTLVNGYQTEGVKTVSWDGKEESGTRVASGVYLYRISADGFSQTKKMILAK